MAWEKNIGAFVSEAAVGAGAATAAGTGDNTKVTGQTIDRWNYASGVLEIVYKAVLTEAKTLSFAVEYEESADGTTWDTAVAIQAATVAATGATGGSTNYGVVKFDRDLSARKRYVRYNITPDLSATGTDTLNWAAVFILGGANNVPA